MSTTVQMELVETHTFEITTEVYSPKILYTKPSNSNLLENAISPFQKRSMENIHLNTTTEAPINLYTMSATVRAEISMLLWPTAEIAILTDGEIKLNFTSEIHSETIKNYPTYISIKYRSILKMLMFSQDPKVNS